MLKKEKVCPVVMRQNNTYFEFLGFVHPTAGRQFIKGTIENGETAVNAAIRELKEESGLTPPGPLMSLGACPSGKDEILWHFFLYLSSDLPEAWQHSTEDDYGHTFTFFWHPLGDSLNDTWHPIFHQAYEFFVPCIFRQ